MKSIRLLAIVSVFLLAYLSISSCRKRQEQVQKWPSGTIKAAFIYPNESPFTTAERRARNVTIEMGTLTCTADTGLFNKTGQIRLIGDVVVRTADGVKITAEEVVFGSYSPVENSSL